jgi:hypothetical protein
MRVPSFCSKLLQNTLSVSFKDLLTKMGGNEMKRARLGGYLYVKKSKWIRIN